MHETRRRSIRLFDSMMLAVFATAGMTPILLADDITKPIAVSADGHFLMQPDGQPFFWLSDFPQELITRTTREEADQYLRDRSHKGYTVIFIGALAYFDNVKVGASLPNEVRNVYGAAPFVAGDFARPNQKYFDYLVWVVARSAQYGLRVALVPVWGLGAIPTGSLTEKTAVTYGKWLGSRYRGKGIIWVLGGDLTPLWRRYGRSGNPAGNSIFDFRPVIDALASGIVEGDGGKPLFTYHIGCCSFPGTAPPRTSQYFWDRKWLSINYVQETSFVDLEEVLKNQGLSEAWRDGFEYEPIRAEYASRPTRPVVAADPNADGSPVDDVFNTDAKAGAKGRYGAKELRFYAYESVFSGAAGCGYFNNSVYQFYDPGRAPPLFDPESTWQQALDSPGSRQVAYVKKLMLSRPYFTRIPDQGVIVGYSGEGRAHISATRDRGGSYIMVYLPQGQPVTVEMNRLSGSTAIGWWFDPRTGQATRIKDSISTDHQQQFVPPSSGPANDWVLVLDDESKEYSSP